MTKAPSKFVTAFAGRRDSYQVPLALAEAGLLEKFITTGYCKPYAKQLAATLPSSLRSALNARYCEALPNQAVTAIWRAEAYEQLGRLLKISPLRYWAKINQILSQAAAREAERSNADLLLYEPYAVEAFTRRYRNRTPRKILFHFHPHPDYEAELLDADQHKNPFSFSWPTLDGGGNRDPHHLAVRQVWRHADLILCASSVTKKSIVAAGAAADICRVIPYGVDAADAFPEYTGGDRYRVLFVGTGVQRKGLHILLQAWACANLPVDAELTLVCRSIDPALEELAKRTPRCLLLSGVSKTKLKELFRSSDLFALPSLLEGFGLSYLEALAEGCPVLGTDATGVPDLGCESDGVFTIPAGDKDALVSSLQACVENTANLALRRRAWATARKFTWKRFRSQLFEEVT